MTAATPAPPVVRLRAAAAGAAVLLTLLSVILLTGLGGERFVLTVDDLAQALAAAAATASAAACAARSRGRLRRAWTALAVGCACWAAGQSVWSWYELAVGRETPFPSVADLGFLGFPVGAAVALAVYPAGGVHGDRRRRLLDGLTATTALALVSWSTALGEVVRTGADGPLALLVSLAYPAGDLVLLVLVILLVGRATHDRGALGLVAAGVAAIAVSDSAFLHLTATGAYGSDDHAVSLGWCAGFALLALAPLAVDRGGQPEDEERVGSAPVSFLPYVPVAVAAITVGLNTLAGRPAGVVELTLGALVIGLVLARQYTTVQDNGRLAAELAVREAELRHQAFHDGLTGLANRALFHDRVGHALELHQRDQRPLAVLFCDLDDFKAVNDTLGHASGDALLVQVAERLHGALRSADTLARLGGDEFAVLLEDTNEPAAVADKLVEAMRAPFALAGRSLHVGTSIGLAVVTPALPTPSADALLAQADTAMYAAKRGGKGRLRTYGPEMTLDELTGAELARELGAAIAAGTVGLAYQPVVHLSTGRVVGVEALARWTRSGEPVPPSTFVPLAERTGLIGPLTALVLEQACAQAARWAAELGPAAPRTVINLSPQSVCDRDLPAQVAAALARHAVPGQLFGLEVTESGLLEDPAAAREVCTALRAQGIGLALDDFGVGFSSLAHLSRLPLDCVKLDRAFLDGLNDAEQTRFVRAVLRLGAELGLYVVAEGIETTEQLALLRELGCQLGQGYLLQRPVAAETLTPLLREPLLGAPRLSTPVVLGT